MVEQTTVLDVLHSILPPVVKSIWENIGFNQKRFQDSKIGLAILGTLLITALLFVGLTSFVVGPVWGWVILWAVTAAVFLVVSTWQFRYHTSLIADFEQRYMARCKSEPSDWLWVVIDSITYAPGKVLVVVVHRTGKVFPFLPRSDAVYAMRHFVNQMRIDTALPVVGMTLPVVFHNPILYAGDFANLMTAITRATGWPLEFVHEPVELRDAAEQYQQLYAVHARGQTVY